jgi:diphthamide synthase subunit DPH2
MIITICSSIQFWPQILEIKKQLENMGHAVLIPPHQVKNEAGEMIPVEEYYRIRKQMIDNKENDDWIWERKSEAIHWHLEKVNKADAILVLNYDKNNIANYIGGNTLIELGLAFYLHIPIYLYNPIPEEVSYYEEIKGMQPIVVNGDLNLIK